MQYYTTMPAMMNRFEAIGAQMRFGGGGIEQFETWKAELRHELSALTGLDRMQHCPLNPEITEETQLDGYTRQRVLLQVEPGIIMPLFVLLPDGLADGEKRAAVIATHGHGSHGKHAVAGMRLNAEMEKTIEQHHYDYGVQFVKQGFIVFCPDARGFGERRESTTQGDAPGQMLRCSCQQLNNMLIPLGQTVIGAWTWDLMRLIDYIETRSEADPARIGCAGLSGGGQQALWITAMDDRIKCVTISGYMYGSLESLLVMSGNCSCNYIPHLWEKVDMGDVASLIAPRPMVVETGDKDPLNSTGGLANVTSQIDIIRRTYAVFEKEDCLVHDVFAGEHRWNGLVAIPKFMEWLK